MRKEELKIEGYWYSKHYEEKGIDYPMPVASVLDKRKSIQIYNLIILKEAEARIEKYMGGSMSRITNEMLGCGEYQTDEWKWPADFAPHYVLEYGVRPTDEFLDYIGYKESYDDISYNERLELLRLLYPVLFENIMYYPDGLPSLMNELGIPTKNGKGYYVISTDEKLKKELEETAKNFYKKIYG